MRFKGQLLLPSEPGPGLRVNLEVAGHHLAVESENGELGAWPLEAVSVRRVEGSTFAMTVAGEDLHFLADDTISFAYSGMPAIERVSGPARGSSRLRTLLDKFGSESPKPSPMPMQPPEAEPSAVVDRTYPATGELRDIESTEPIEDEIVDMAALSVEPELEPIPVFSPQSQRLPSQEQVETVPSDRAPEGEKEPAGCLGVTSDGLPCRSPILAPSGYCYPHDPERSVEDDYRKALEARASLKREGTTRLTRVYSRLEKAMRRVERGELDPEIAVAMAQLARTMCAILDLDDEPGEEPDQTLAPRF